MKVLTWYFKHAGGSESLPRAGVIARPVPPQPSGPAPLPPQGCVLQGRVFSPSCRTAEEVLPVPTPHPLRASACSPVWPLHWFMVFRGTLLRAKLPSSSGRSGPRAALCAWPPDSQALVPAFPRQTVGVVPAGLLAPLGPRP